MVIGGYSRCFDSFCYFFFSSRRRHTRCALVTGVQTWLFRSSTSSQPQNKPSTKACDRLWNDFVRLRKEPSRHACNSLLESKAEFDMICLKRSLMHNLQSSLCLGDWCTKWSDS